MAFRFPNFGDILHAAGVGFQVIVAVESLQSGGSGSIDVSVHGKEYVVSVAPKVV